MGGDGGGMLDIGKRGSFLSVLKFMKGNDAVDIYKRVGGGGEKGFAGFLLV